MLFLSLSLSSPCLCMQRAHILSFPSIPSHLIPSPPLCRHQAGVSSLVAAIHLFLHLVSLSSFYYCHDGYTILLALPLTLSPSQAISPWRTCALDQPSSLGSDPVHLFLSFLSCTHLITFVYLYSLHVCVCLCALAPLVFSGSNNRRRSIAFLGTATHLHTHIISLTLFLSHLPARGTCHPSPAT